MGFETQHQFFSNPILPLNGKILNEKSAVKIHEPTEGKYYLQEHSSREYNELEITPTVAATLRMKSELTRNGIALTRKFNRFFLPSALTVAATSLSEFVDSIIVGQMLGADAMSLVNIGQPLLLIAASVVMLIGLGGAILYAESSGRQDGKEKDFLTVSISVMVVLAFVYMAIGLLFSDEIARMMCDEEGLSQLFEEYIRIIFYSIPIVMLTQALLMFVPTAGRPEIATLVNLIANGLNIFGDFIFIRYFTQDVTGAAWGTFSGYCIGFTVIIILMAKGKIRLKAARLRKGLILPKLPVICKRGGAMAAAQLGLALKVACCNGIALSIGGIDAVAVLSVCLQSLSISCIFLGGVVNSLNPIVAVLHGQRDYSGMRFLMNYVTKMQLIMFTALFVLFELFPAQFLGCFGLTQEVAQAGITPFRIFCIMYLFRQTIVIFSAYLQSIDMKFYAAAVGVCESFVITVPVVILLTSLLGLTGLWISFPVGSALILLITFFVNIRLSKAERFTGIMLIEAREPGVKIMEMTVPGSPDAIEAAADEIRRFLHEEAAAHNEEPADHGAGSLPGMCEAMLPGMCEAMLEKLTPRGKSRGNVIDVMITIEEGTAFASLRADGKPVEEADHEEGGCEIKYAYIIGMNILTVRTNGEVR